MLVLTRKAGEAILIGDEVEVEIVAVDGNKVRVGIVAPNDIDVARRGRDEGTEDPAA